MEPADDDPRPTRLAVIFVQYDRGKHHGGLTALLGALSSVAAESTVVVVDNLHPGDWVHSVTENLHHIGGDNSHWEFSAFEKGVEWLSRRGLDADVYAFATDSLLAYGADFLELVDDRVIECTRRHSVCVGWIDSFMERCEVLGYAYDAWLRTSLVFVPARVLPFLQPLAPRLDDEDLFSDSPATPFRPTAPVSENLRRLLLQWLTTGGSAENRDGQLDHAWHSQFALDAETFERFKGKAKAILREHLLSARLKALGVGCYDLRAVRLAAEVSLVEAAMRGESAADWQWLGWLRIAGEPVDGSSAAGHAWGDGDLGTLARVSSAGEDAARPTFLVAPPENDSEADAAVRYFEQAVLPLVLQRHASARLAANGGGGEPATDAPAAPAAPVVPLPVDGEDPPSGAVALLLPPDAPAPPGAARLAAAWGLPVVGPCLVAGDRLAVDGLHCLRAERPLEYAEACCRLIEESDLRESLARGLAEWSEGEPGESAEA